MIDSAFETAGYTLLDAADTRRLGEFPTWEKDGLRIALYRESLDLQRGQVLRRAAAGKEITLHGIIVDLDKRLKGKADAAMRLLLGAADRHSVTIYIEPVPMVRGGMNRSQLVAFYGKRGFVGTDATNKVMRRLAAASQPAHSADAIVVARRTPAYCVNDLGREPTPFERPGAFVPAFAGV